MLKRPQPNTPQAAHPGPISVQESLPTQRILRSTTTLEGHAPGGLAVADHIGRAANAKTWVPRGKPEKPSVQMNSQELPTMQAGTLLSRKWQFELAAPSLI